jgi:AcrR family transcriptional regulator
LQNCNLNLPPRLQERWNFENPVTCAMDSQTRDRGDLRRGYRDDRGLSRTRLKPEERKTQILAAAADAVVAQGYLPVSLEALAKKLDVSKALIYAYFPTQLHLVNGLLHEYYPSMAEAQLKVLRDQDDLLATAQLCAATYFDHVAQVGPLLHILTSDLYATGKIDDDILALQRRVAVGLADAIRRTTSLDPKRGLASVRLIISLVEEAGTLAFRGAHETALCRSLCLDLVAGGLEELQAQARPRNAAKRTAAAS